MTDGSFKTTSDPNRAFGPTLGNRQVGQFDDQATGKCPGAPDGQSATDMYCPHCGKKYESLPNLLLSCNSFNRAFRVPMDMLMSRWVEIISRMELCGCPLSKYSSITVFHNCKNTFLKTNLFSNYILKTHSWIYLQNGIITSLLTLLTVLKTN